MRNGGMPWNGRWSFPGRKTLAASFAVFQNFAFLNRYTVYENLEAPLLARGLRKNREKIMNLFEELHHEGRTIIIATHDEAIAERCDRKIRIKDRIKDGIKDGKIMIDNN